jgi:hypothetical protein
MVNLETVHCIATAVPAVLAFWVVARRASTPLKAVAGHQTFPTRSLQRASVHLNVPITFVSSISTFMRHAVRAVVPYML